MDNEVKHFMGTTTKPEIEVSDVPMTTAMLTLYWSEIRIRKPVTSFQ